MQDSIFTKILKGEVPGIIVWQDEKAFILMDKFPSVEGQALVIPKTQIDYMFSLDEELYLHLWHITNHLARAMNASFPNTRVCVVVEGFDVPHVHIRVYPVPHGKPLIAHKGEMADDEVMEKLAQTIRSSLTL